MKIANTKTLLAALASATLAGGATAATSVVVGAETNAQPTIDTTGTVLRAYNLGAGSNVNGGSPGDTSVHQGITFDNVAITGNHVTANYYVDISAYAGHVGGVQVRTTNPADTHFGNYTSGGDGLAQQFIYVNGSTDQEINVSGLDNTKEYLVQLIVGDDRGSSTFFNNIIVDGVDSGVDLNWQNSGANNIAAVTVSGQTSVDIELDSYAGWGPGVSGVVVSEVPEPSSLALLGLGGLLIARRRRG